MLSTPKGFLNPLGVMNTALNNESNTNVRITNDADSISTDTIVKTDTIAKTDTIINKTDTIAGKPDTSKKEGEDLKSKIKYHARDSMRVDVENQIVYLYGAAIVDYQDLHL